MITLFVLLVIFFMIFILFTAAQIIGFVFTAIGWIISGLFALLGWIVCGSWALLKAILVLAALVFFGCFKLIGLAALALMILLIIGVARAAFDNRRPVYRNRCADSYENDTCYRLRRDLNRMRRRMENLETILGKS